MLKIAFHPSYIYPLPPKHRFPMEKYELLPQQLLYEGTCTAENFFEPEILNDKYTLAVHDAEYYYDFLNLKLSQKEIRKTGFPLSRSLVTRECLIAGGTVQAACYALENGVGMNIAGGTHHAYSDRGEGFCMLNDQAIAAQYLLNKGLTKKVLIIDLDEGVYQFSTSGNANTFEFAGIIVNGSLDEEEEATFYEISSGSFEVLDNGNSYKFEFEGKTTDGQDFSGSYKGSLAKNDYSNELGRGTIKNKRSFFKK